MRYYWYVHVPEKELNQNEHAAVPDATITLSSIKMSRIAFFNPWNTIQIYMTGESPWEFHPNRNHTESFAAPSGHWLCTIAQKQLRRLFTSNIRGCQQRRFTWEVETSKEVRFQRSPILWPVMHVREGDPFRSQKFARSECAKTTHYSVKLAPSPNQRNTWCVA